MASVAAGVVAVLAALLGKGLGMDSTMRAPDFPKGLAWLNTERSLQLAGELKGQVVLLDFWTYCCINCMHVLPDLAALEEKYKDQPFVVVGVHSNKFANEGELANVRAAIQRYTVTHPVVVDENQRIWNEYAVNSWPTLVLVGSDGRIVGQVSGEGNRAVLEKAIDAALKAGREKGTLAKGPLQFAREGMVRSASGLAFPARALADAAGQRLLIVDSNHHRLVVTTWPDAMGRCQATRVIGSGKAGKTDGEAAAAEFHRPQGAAVAGEVAYVADTENHLIRRVDLKTGRVSTILGTGKQEFDAEGGKSGRAQGLNSPWDVAVGKKELYIAMAGDHQIWALNLLSGMAEPIAGSGRENIRDGAAREANLAQTSGLALDEAAGRLYFADSEVSAVRYLDLQARTVNTLVGQGLFVFGDVDGAAGQARLQHPLGVGLWSGKVLVADTYNHKIRQVDPANGTVETFAGTGKPGTGTPGATLGLYEPGGVSAAEGKVFVADTNNHRVVVVDAASRAWREVLIDGLGAPQAPAVAAGPAGAELTVAAGRPVTLKLAVKLPVGTHLTPGAPVAVMVSSGGKKIWQQTLAEPAVPVAVTVPAEAVGTGGAWSVRVDYTFCTDGAGAVCKPGEQTWNVKVKTGAGGKGEMVLE